MDTIIHNAVHILLALTLPPLLPGDRWVDQVTGDFRGDGKTDYAAEEQPQAAKRHTGQLVEADQKPHHHSDTNER